MPNNRSQCKEFPGRVLGVIPARLRSQRLPGKMLRLLHGQPLLAWTYAAAKACPQLDEVWVACDSDEVAMLCQQRGWPFLHTSPELPSGTDRLYAVSQEVAASVYVNIQGDEPLVTRQHIDSLLAPFCDEDVDATTLSVACPPEEFLDPNTVKVVTALNGRALFFSRAPIPFHRDAGGSGPAAKHLGLYAYRRGALERFARLPPSPLEQTERLEQLRLLENGLTLHVRQVTQGTVGVDTEADLERVTALLAGRPRPQPLSQVSLPESEA